MASKRKPKTLSDQLRDIILNSSMSRYKICKLSGIDQSQMHRFLNGEGRLTTDTLDKIAAVLNLRLMTEERER